MPRFIKPPLSIADIGLEHYLNQTRHKHNGHGYDDWQLFLAQRKTIHLSAHQIALLMNISRDTFYRYLKYETGQTST
jgi:response regulator of citrate/malate metabolism